MLQFVFFHWPKADVDRAVYIAHLRQFHQRLRTEMRGQSFSGSAVFAMDSPPGVLFQGRIFADWYGVNAWASIETFKATAVGAVAVEHAAVAQEMEGGAGAMYDARAGAATPPAQARHSYWFSKPKGMAYAELDTLLAPAVAKEGVTLWQRQLVLGPTPEFLITSASALTLPTNLDAQHREQTPI